MATEAVITAPVSAPDASPQPNTAFVGVWKCTSSASNFEEILEVSGLPWVFRKLIKAVKPTQIITVSPDGSVVEVTMKAGPKTMKTRHEIGVECENEGPGGKSKGTLTWEDGVMVFTGTDHKGRAARQVRVLEDDGATLRMFFELEGRSTWRLFTRKEGK